MVTDATLPQFEVDGVSDETAGHYDRGKTLNLQNIHGDGVRVGIFETLRGSCGIGHAHEAFEWATVTYQSPSLVTCNTNADCTASICGADQNEDDSDYLCQNGHCIGSHATKVASRIASSVNSVRNHAAKADLYIGNDLGDYYLSDFIDSMDWLAGNNVYIVNNSIGQRDAKWSSLDHARDWFARYREMTFTKSSGNFDPNETESTWVVGCHSLNSVCVGGTNASGTYGDAFANDVMYTNSKWRNPTYSDRHAFAGDQKEAERPDVVSEGEDAWVAKPGTTTQWEKGDGTSLSAPAVAGLLAQQLEYCGITARSPLMNRAMLRTAAWSGQYLEPTSNAPMYPIPGLSPDSHAGAGITEASRLASFCDGGGAGYAANTAGGAWSPGMGSSPPSWMYAETQDPNLVVRQDEWQQWESGLRQSNVEYWPLWQIGRAESGARVRATFSFDTCPAGSPSQVPGTISPAVDFDLLLCSFDAERCFGVSESMDDTNEGFDVQIDANVRDLTLLAIAPVNATPCDSNEPYAWAATVWP